MFNDQIFEQIKVHSKNQNAVARLLTAINQLEENKIDFAEVNLARTKVDETPEHWYFLARGKLAFAQEDYAKAEEFFNRVIAANPLFKIAYNDLLNVYNKQGDQEKLDDLTKEIAAVFDPASLAKSQHETANISANTISDIEKQSMSTIPEGDDDLDDMVIPVSTVPPEELQNHGTAETSDDDRSQNKEMLNDIIAEIEDKGTSTEEPRQPAEFGDVMSDIFDQPGTEPAEESPKEKPRKNSSVISFEMEEPAALTDKIPQGNGNKAQKPKKIMTKTLGEIYASQGRYDEAIEVFESLLEQNPADEELNNKIRELKNQQ
jgi:tetratricopeptide (TPR) repeat protein